MDPGVLRDRAAVRADQAVDRVEAVAAHPEVVVGAVEGRVEDAAGAHAVEGVGVGARERRRQHRPHPHYRRRPTLTTSLGPRFVGPSTALCSTVKLLSSTHTTG
jgi:hypothetical protein